MRFSDSDKEEAGSRKARVLALRDLLEQIREPAPTCSHQNLIDVLNLMLLFEYNILISNLKKLRK